VGKRTREEKARPGTGESAQVWVGTPPQKFVAKKVRILLSNENADTIETFTLQSAEISAWTTPSRNTAPGFAAFSTASMPFYCSKAQRCFSWRKAKPFLGRTAHVHGLHKFDLLPALPN
jgi:hypothetical protein